MRFKKWLLKFVEKRVGIYREGPEIPTRLLLQVPDFRAANPDATLDDWELMAVNLARDVYLQGYIRGYERAEREEILGTNPTPDEIADYEFPGWRELSKPIPFEAFQPLEIEEE